MIKGWLAGEGVTTVVYPSPTDGIVKLIAEAMKSHGGEVRAGHKVIEVII
ncbi:hypothetical protein [Calorimonas adulescens]|nr:hypothetical protein [Calorimonas adulescens]